MPYIVQPGREVSDGMTYRAGDEYPGDAGSHPELVADGAVVWVEPEKPAEKKPAAKKAAAPRKAAK